MILNQTNSFVDIAFDRQDVPTLLQQATALDAYTAAESVPYADFLARRARALAAVMQGEHDTADRALIGQLRDEAERAGWSLRWPAS